MSNHHREAPTAFVADPVERQVRHLVRQCAGHAALFDRELRYLSVSDAFLSAYGLQRDAVLGRLHYEVFRNVPDRWKQIHERVLRGEDCRAELDLFVRANGSPQWLRWSMTPWRRADGEIGGAVVTLADVTEARNLQESLRSTEAILTTLFENVTVGVAILDGDGRFERSNGSFRAITGYSPEDLQGMFIGSAVHPHDACNEIAAMDRLRRGEGSVHEARFRLVRKDGQVIVVEQMLAAIDAPSEGGRRLAAILRDVTERVELDLRLRQSERLTTIGLLAEALAHDLGNVLAAFRGAIAGLRHGADHAAPPEARLDGVDVIDQGTDYLQRLVDGLRLLSNARAGEPAPLDGSPPAKARLSEWWERSSVLLRTAIPKSIALESRIDPGLVPARIDAGHLTQVVLNLAMNAAQAIQDRGHPVHGTILIEAKPDDGGERISLSVSDDGVGIDPAQVRRVTDRYVTTRSGSGGCGIGLSVAQRIVDEHGGGMRFRSRPGFGTTVTVTLPAADR